MSNPAQTWGSFSFSVLFYLLFMIVYNIIRIHMYMYYAIRMYSLTKDYFFLVLEEKHSI